MITTWTRKIRLLLCAVLLSLSSAAGAAYSQLYILGDSLSDTGNLYAATSTLPQAPYYDGRFSNGPIYAEYLWSSLGFSGSLKPSYLGGTDYAVGGARSRYHSFDNLNPSFDPLTTPSAYYGFSLLGQRDALLAKYGSGLDGNALYTVWEGSNDMSDAITLWFKKAYGQAIALIKQAASDFIAVIKSLVGAGARHLLIPNIPNLGLVPEIVALGSSEAQYWASQLTLQYNGLIDAGLATINADIMRLDTYGILTDIVDDPTAYGLSAGTNVDTACFTGFVGKPGEVCSDPENYVFWDQIHPSAMLHATLGTLAAAAVPEPAGTALVALALLVLLGTHRHRRGEPEHRAA